MAAKEKTETKISSHDEQPHRLSNWYGFNFQWMYKKDVVRPLADQIPTEPLPVDKKALDFMFAHGFNFVRLPIDYRFLLSPDDYRTFDDGNFKILDEYIDACRSRKLHACVNLHRAPGYCINRPELEKHNLWRDAEAQTGFIFFWETLAKRYKNIPDAELSFDMVNEPRGDDAEWEAHDRLMRKTVSAIRAVSPGRIVVLDGWHVGNVPLPRLADLKCVQSMRGYLPFPLTHYGAPWSKTNWDEVPAPVWPELREKDKIWNVDTIREHYRQWAEIEKTGTPVHVGEFGCFNRTPNAVALKWFADILSVYREMRWGWGLWNFTGAFGIVEHGRPGAVYENLDGFNVDRQLLTLLKNSMV